MPNINKCCTLKNDEHSSGYPVKVTFAEMTDSVFNFAETN